ncbi:unnamed protein product [Prorocentrum cordatum]|uniref:Uncharacterized protein n=1 Tax=Prorocentrum cordatum TaxID=2364126 RepID=A0ABN9TFC1_9DINO|nr:unnamed protein product [Polarella glacialis]
MRMPMPELKLKLKPKLKPSLSSVVRSQPWKYMGVPWDCHKMYVTGNPLATPIGNAQRKWNTRNLLLPLNGVWKEGGKTRGRRRRGEHGDGAGGRGRTRTTERRKATTPATSTA